jgi:F-type H+-transporting ATPase subunit gamma
MAQNLRLLDRRIKTAKNIAQIAKAMEMISASKIKKAQNIVIQNKPYAQRISELTGSILKKTDPEKFTHPYLTKKGTLGTLVIVISTDKGLCGSLNTNLFKKLLEIDSKDIKYVALGKKAIQFCTKLAGDIVGDIPLGTTLPDYTNVYRLIEAINTEYLRGAASSVKVLYNEFNSVFSQEPTLTNLLPIETISEEVDLPYIFEPNAEEMLRELLPYYLEVKLYTSLLESFTSEQGARMIAMQNAKNNALDIADYLRLTYNKSRQERITNELITLANNI